MKRSPLDPTLLFPFSVFSSPPATAPVMWLQSPNQRMNGHTHWAPENLRVSIGWSGRPGDFNPLCDAALALMMRERGGYPDRYDPLFFRCVSVDTRDMRSYQTTDGFVFVNGTCSSGGSEGVNLQFSLHGGASLLVSRLGAKLIPPLKASQSFTWDVLDDEGFERLMYRLFVELADDFEDVQWLQKTRAADSGRDLSAKRRCNGNRVLIQARHQQASITAPDVNDVVVKAETWVPAFSEVIIVTTSAFTQEAVRWTELHNERRNRPIVILEPRGHLEVKLSSHPQLIAHSGLRS